MAIYSYSNRDKMYVIKWCNIFRFSSWAKNDSNETTYCIGLRKIPSLLAGIPCSSYGPQGRIPVTLPVQWPRF